jgi:hypothetical protein
MKKILAVLVIFMFILTVFAACGRRRGNMIGTDSFPDLPNASSKVNGTDTPSKEVTSAEIEDAWGNTSIDNDAGNSSSSSSSSTSSSSSSSSKPGSTSSSTSSYDRFNSSNQGFDPYYPFI